MQGGLPPERCLALLPGASPLEEGLRAAGVRVEVIPLEERALGEGGRSLALLASKRRYFRAITGRLRAPDVEAVYVNSGIQVMPGIAASRAGRPVLWHIREAWGAGLAWRVKRAVIARVSRTILFAGEAARAHFGPVPPGVRALPVMNGTPESLALLRGRRGELRARYGWPEGVPVVAFAGTLVARKGVPELLAAWPAVRAGHPGARLVLAGAPDPNERDAAIRAALASPPEGVELLGFRSDVPEIFAAADAMVLPSHGEAFPNTVVEAMMAGTPVVATPVADVPRLLGDGRGLLIGGAGAEGIAAALREALGNPAASAERAARAQEFARRELTWDRQCAIIRAEIEALAR
jgi:glycosyltransferase involved in cell wall biosynthesis